jgi:hypothetical protein
MERAQEVGEAKKRKRERVQKAVQKRQKLSEKAKKDQLLQRAMMEDGGEIFR